MKIFTEVATEKMNPQIEWGDGIFLIGSCFADEVGALLKSYGLDCCTNPFGTQYNVCSIFNSLIRLSDAVPFTSEDVLQRPDGLYVTFSHHSRCGCSDSDEFLQKANTELVAAAEKLHGAKFLIITLGTSFVYTKDGEVVSNCHKLPAKEFVKEFVHTEQCTQILEKIAAMFPDKTTIFTVSPIRHLGDGEHLNQISKSTLLTAVQRVVYGPKYQTVPKKGLYYFPAYEIMLDELRDYRWYGEDLCHPTAAAVKYIFEKFKSACIAPSAYDAMAKAHKEELFRNHRPLSSR